MAISFKLGKERTTGKTVTIDVALRGLSCDCVCFDCGKQLIAAKGEKNEWHYRHYEETNCKGGQETALHKLAKQLIIEGSSIILKHYGKILYEGAKQEIPFQSIQPDIWARTNEQDFFFEVLVTHAIDNDKRNFYENGAYKSIEINLKGYEFTTVEQLRQDIFNNSDFNEIIFWERVPVKVKSKDNSALFFLFILGLITFGLITTLKKRRKKWQ